MRMDGKKLLPWLMEPHLSVVFPHLKRELELGGGENTSA